MTELIIVVVLCGVAGCLWYLWRHKTGTAARGIAAAGVRYNELNGQGRPPEISSTASHPSTDGNDVDPDP